jgi:DNA-binding NtrC family response regulator
MDALEAVPTGLSKRPPTVLIVENDFLVRWRAAEYLRERNFTVIEANDALDAIGLLASDVRVDIVVSDARLSYELKQIGLIEWFKRHHPQVPLLVTSSDPAECTQVADNEKRRFIAKPYELAELHSHIESMLNRP